MTKVNSPRGRVSVALLAAFVAIAVIAAQHWTATSSAANPTLTGDFCTFNGNMFCMTLTWNGVAYGTPNRANLALQPGTYSLTVNDTSAAHDFALRSCPGSTSHVRPDQPCRNDNRNHDPGADRDRHGVDRADPRHLQALLRRHHP